ncbi:Protein NEOXANTHIN-DEFICIENT 1 [Glycine soja]
MRACQLMIPLDVIHQMPGWVALAFGTLVTTFHGQENSDAEEGLPIFFTPFAEEDDVVKVNREFKVTFSAASICVQGTNWNLAEKDSQSGRRLIAASGSDDYLRITKTPINGTYYIGWCPTYECPLCRFDSGIVGGLRENGKILLALDEFMEAVEAKASSGYGKPPWVFRGRQVAWYQLHLVKAEKARAYIPKEFKLVEAFGQVYLYTLGGFFLASYEDSPVGVFDEEVGLPSQMARFSKTITAISRQQREIKSGFLNRIGIGAKYSTPKDPLNVQVTKIKCLDAEDTCNINISLTSPVSALGIGHWMGPTTRMSLPSFSGATEYNPNLLKYSCQIECRVQALKPLKVSGAFPSTNDDTELSLEDYGSSSHVAKDHKNDAQNFSTCVMLSKPILALKFNQMMMQVEAPLVLSQCSNSLETTVSSVP